MPLAWESTSPMSDWWCTTTCRRASRATTRKPDGRGGMAFQVSAYCTSPTAANRGKSSSSTRLKMPRNGNAPDSGWNRSFRYAACRPVAASLCWNTWVKSGRMRTAAGAITAYSPANDTMPPKSLKRYCQQSFALASGSGRRTSLTCCAGAKERRFAPKATTNCRSMA